MLRFAISRILGCKSRLFWNDETFGRLSTRLMEGNSSGILHWFNYVKLLHHTSCSDVPKKDGIECVLTTHHPKELDPDGEKS